MILKRVLVLFEANLKNWSPDKRTTFPDAPVRIIIGRSFLKFRVGGTLIYSVFVPKASM